MKRLLGIVALLLIGYVVLHSSGAGFRWTLPASAANVWSFSVGGGVGTGLYQDMAREDAAVAGIPASLFVAQIKQESGFNAAARGSMGEIGIAQFMPATAAGLGVNPADPVASLKAAANLMGRYYRAYGANYAMALADYNCGSGCVHQAMRYSAWGCHVPISTQAYIRSIMNESVC